MPSAITPARADRAPQRRGPIAALMAPYGRSETWLAVMHLAVGLILGSLFFSLALSFTVTSIAVVPVFFVAVPFFTFTFAIAGVACVLAAAISDFIFAR